MRKLNFIIKGALFLALTNYPLTYLAQDFGRSALQECWRLETDKITNFRIASDNARLIFLPLSNGSLEALDKNTGKAIWQTNLGGEFISSPVLNEQTVYISSKSNNLNNSDNSSNVNKETVVIRGLSTETGITKWQQSLPLENKLYLSCQPKGLYVFTESGSIYLLNKENGQINFKQKLSAEPSKFLYFDGANIYYLTTGNNLTVASSETGKTINEFGGKYPIPAVVVTKGVVFSGDDFGNVQASQINNKKTVWKSRVGASITSLTVTPEGLLATSQDNYVYMFLIRDGKKIWKKRLSGRPSGEPIIKDGVALISVLGGSNAEYIDLKNGKQVNQIVVGEDEYFTGPPALINGLAVFPTSRGVYAFGAKDDCRIL